jgi:putative pyruvate formate lyase activating enzyme
LPRLNASVVWQDEAVRDRLSWYYGVLRDVRPAKFLLCKQVALNQDPRTMAEPQLWDEHEKLHAEFLRLLRRIRDGERIGNPAERPAFSFLDLKVELLNRILEKCILCEWRCKTNRKIGVGRCTCNLGSTPRVATFFLHQGEEPPLVDRHGSGTIFFASCTFRCIFCQNWDISQHPSAGAPVSAERLSLIMMSLRSEGAANINLVGGEPTPNLPAIMKALGLATVNVPILWNSNMYLTAETMRILEDVVDVWLPDFKWGNDRCAVKYSRVIRYFDVVSRNHSIAYENGDMIIRHLIMPGHLECCTKPILDWVASKCPRALVNIMGQYRPEHLVLREPEKYHEIARYPTPREVEGAQEYADRLGILWEPVS